MDLPVGQKICPEHDCRKLVVLAASRHPLTGQGITKTLGPKRALRTSKALVG